MHLAAVKLIGEIKDSPSSLAKCQPVYTKVQPAICSLHSPYRHMEIGQQKAIKKLYSLPGSIKKEAYKKLGLVIICFSHNLALKTT